MLDPAGAAQRLCATLVAVTSLFWSWVLAPAGILPPAHEQQRVTNHLHLSHLIYLQDYRACLHNGIVVGASGALSSQPWIY